MKKFGNGISFKVLPNGQKIDSEGFMTSSWTTRVRPPYFCVSIKKNEDNSISIRNTNDKTLKTLKFTKEEWEAFVKGVKNGEFD